VKSSLLNLIVGIIWIPLWIYHGFNFYLLKGFLIIGVLELLIVLPIGFALVYDWFAYGIHKKPNFLDQPLWNIPDYAFFITGIFGSASMFIALFLKFERNETFVMGLLGATIAFLHFLRRKIRIEGHM